MLSDRQRTTFETGGGLNGTKAKSGDCPSMASPVDRPQHHDVDFLWTTLSVKRTGIVAELSFTPDSSGLDDVVRMPKPPRRFPSTGSFRVLELLACHRQCCPRTSRRLNHWDKSAWLVAASLVSSWCHPISTAKTTNSRQHELPGY